MRLNKKIGGLLPALAGALMVSACNSAPVHSYRVGEDNVYRFESSSSSFSETQNTGAYLRKGIFYALPKSLIKLTVDRSKADNTRITAVNEIYPDASAVYRTVIETSPFAHDTIEIAVDASMLLSSVNSKNKDESVAISEKVVTLVQNVLVGGAESLTASETTATKPQLAVVQFDPFDPRETCESALQAGVTLRVTNLGAKSFGCLGGSVTGVEGTETDASDVGSVIPDVPVNCSEGVCFRLVRPVIIHVEDQDPTTRATYVSEHVAIVPDPSLEVAYDISRAACVEKNTTLTFTKGLLTRASIAKPSEVLNCLSIPAQVVAAVLGFPEAVDTRKAARLDREKGLIDKQIALIDSQQKFIDKQASASGESK